MISQLITFSFVQLIVATELLLGSDNSSIDIDFSYILAVAQSFSLLLLKKLLIFLHNGQNHKVGLVI